MEKTLIQFIKAAASKLHDGKLKQPSGKEISLMILKERIFDSDTHKDLTIRVICVQTRIFV